MEFKPVFLKSTNKAITVVALSSFLVSSAIPSYENGTSLENLTEREAIFGWCRITRIKKKTKALLKSIEEFKQGKKTIEEVTYQIASIKRDASKAFKKNYKVHKIMQLANHRIEEFMYSLMNEESVQVKNKFLANLTEHAKLLGSYDLQDHYESINLFLSDLQYYEDNEDYDESQQLLSEVPTFYKELQEVSYSKNNYSNDGRDPESKILFAYVSIFCGCLLCLIPTPFTRNAGFSLISGGFYVLGDDKWNKLDEANKNKKGQE